MESLNGTVKEYLDERDWDVYEQPANLAKSIVIEAAELLEVFQWDNLDRQQLHADPKRLQDAKDELGDVLIYCTELAIALGVPVETLVQEKLAKVKAKYPADVVRGNRGNIVESIRDQRRAGRELSQ